MFGDVDSPVSCLGDDTVPSSLDKDPSPKDSFIGHCGWKRTAMIGSYIWILSAQFMELFEKD